MEGPLGSLVFFSGGTAANSFCITLKKYSNVDITYILPVSDDGGSTSEIVRVIGGPGIGDVRSRLIRLADESSDESRAVMRLLQYRLPLDQITAQLEWNQILDRSHVLWNNISVEYAALIRSFLVHFHHEILRHVQPDGFDWTNGSIGNFFLSGARIFFHSLEAACFMFARVAQVHPKTRVIPVLEDNSRIAIGVQLANGEKLFGQNEISHPHIDRMKPTVVNKSSCMKALESRIVRFFYWKPYQSFLEIEEGLPRSANPRVLAAIQQQQAIIYAMGSLYTSIVPCLVLPGVGDAIAARTNALKIFLLNGHNDRETFGFSATDYIYVLTDALNGKLSSANSHQPIHQRPPSAYITHLVAVEGTPIEINRQEIENLGIRLLFSSANPETLPKSEPKYSDEHLYETLSTILHNNLHPSDSP
jgi:2-phospho-L-lactate transferase/gluconeogenesis factor (CofD/UPF0052 family)